MKSIRKVFAYHLRELRGKRTQEEFSAFLGLALSSYRKMEGGTIPQAETLKLLAKKLGLPSETVLFLDPDIIKSMENAGLKNAYPRDLLIKLASATPEELTTIRLVLQAHAEEKGNFEPEFTEDDSEEF